LRNLALAYRPTSWDGIVGQTAVSQLLKKMVDKGVTPNTILFAGSRGSGKTTTARVLGAALNCEAEVEKPCGKCDSCNAVFDGTSLSYREIDASTHGLVADIRALQEQILYSTPGQYTVLVLDEVHGTSAAASNALLKTLEEAPEHVIFVLVSTEPDKIMNTIHSRCMKFQFRHVAPEVIARRLYEVNQEEHLGVADDVLIALADRSDGALRDALMLLDQISRADVKDMETFQALFGQPDFAPVLLEAMADGNHVRAFSILDEYIAATGNPASVLSAIVRALKDVMVLQGGGSTTLRATPLKSRMQLADRIPAIKLFAAMRVLWELKTKLRVGENSSASLSLAVTMMTGVLKDD
jgi:DNA polymerase III subunit gamma/tau